MSNEEGLYHYGIRLITGHDEKRTDAYPCVRVTFCGAAANGDKYKELSTAALSALHLDRCASFFPSRSGKKTTHLDIITPVHKDDIVKKLTIAFEIINAEDCVIESSNDTENTWARKICHTVLVTC